MAGVADYGVHRTRVYTTGVPRRRGAINGLLLILLGAWGGIVPFIGPQIGLHYTADAAWTLSWAKVWLDVLPGAAVLIGGLGLMGTAARAGGVLWGWLAALGGAWFIIGQTVSQLWTGGKGEFPAPVASTVAGRTFEEIVFFYGLGAVIVFLAGVALGRFTVPARQDAAVPTVEPVAAADSAPTTVLNRRGTDAEPTDTKVPQGDTKLADTKLPAAAEQTTTLPKHATTTTTTTDRPNH